MNMSSPWCRKLTILMALMINESVLFMAKANRSERRNGIHGSDLGGGGHAVGDGVHNNRPGDRKTRTTQVFGALVERPVGRYILATSSLAGECVRVYVPEPFGRMTSFLCTRVRDALYPNDQDILGPDEGQFSPRMSYSRFLSHDGKTDDYLDRLPKNLGPAIQDKYSRVSAAFLARHEIGYAVTGDAAGDTSLRLANQDRAITSGLSTLIVPDERSLQAAPSSLVEKKSASYSMLNSLNILRMKRRTDIRDDLDLLLNLNDEDHLMEPPPVVGGRIDERGENKHVKKGIAAKDHQEPTRSTDVCLTGGLRREGLGALNLISSGDESASQMVNKLRGAHSGPKKRAEKVGHGDSTRQEKSV